MKELNIGQTYLLAVRGIERKATLIYVEQYENGTEYGSYGNYRPSDGTLKLKAV